MKPESAETRARYDSLPYGSYAYAHSAPEQMEAIAALFGVPAPAVPTARILEVGGASGGNLIPAALRNPDAQCVGIELSGVQVARARDHAARLGLSNVEFVEADLLELAPAGLGQFDYIVAHGVYSWIPPEAQQALLALCDACLSPEGVAYVSYNTYPGWKSKEVLRDAMLFHGRGQPPADQVDYGRSMAEFLRRVAREGGVTDLALRENLDQIRIAPADYLAHDYLEPYNLPCYFHEFLREAGRHGLAYLGEALPSMMMPANYGEELARTLYSAVGDDQVRVEQYLDFAIDRAFRQTLLVRSDRADAIQRRPDLEVLSDLHVAVRLDCAEPHIRFDGSRQQFLSPTGQGIATGADATKRAIQRLRAAWPGTVAFDELVAHAQQGSTDSRQREEAQLQVGDLVAMLAFRGVARLRARPVRLGGEQARPILAPDVLRMVQALEAGQKHVANAWHDTVDIGPLEALVFPRLDGSLDRDGLVALVAAHVAEHGPVQLASRNAADPDARPSTDAAVIADRMLGWLQDSGVLAADPAG